MKENEDGSCTVTMANGGHPYPLFYNAKEDAVEEMDLPLELDTLSEISQIPNQNG